MDESAEMSACLELLRLGVMALHGETLGQRATIHGAVREAVGRSALISATLTPLCCRARSSQSTPVSPCSRTQACKADNSSTCHAFVFGIPPAATPENGTENGPRSTTQGRGALPNSFYAGLRAACRSLEAQFFVFGVFCC